MFMVSQRKFIRLKIPSSFHLPTFFEFCHSLHLGYSLFQLLLSNFRSPIFQYLLSQTAFLLSNLHRVPSVSPHPRVHSVSPNYSVFTVSTPLWVASILSPSYEFSLSHFLELLPSHDILEFLLSHALLEYFLPNPSTNFFCLTLFLSFINVNVRLGANSIGSIFFV